MRIRILILFVITQLFSFGLWSHFNAEAALPAVQTSETVRTAAPSAFDHVHFSSRNQSSDTSERSTAILKNRIFKVFKKIPKSHIEAIENIILDFDPEAYRGMGGKRMIILRTDMESREFSGVLIHEIGHNVDLIALQAAKPIKASVFKDGDTPIYLGDASLDFYRISWENETALKKTAGNMDFVSGYAMSDPFEDFAETYTYYVLHNRDFRAKVATSTALFAKYRFMKYRVFNGIEFDTGSDGVDTLARPWDVTVMPYNLEGFLN